MFFKVKHSVTQPFKKPNAKPVTVLPVNGIPRFGKTVVSSLLLKPGIWVAELKLRRSLIKAIESMVRLLPPSSTIEALNSAKKALEYTLNDIVQE
jgi:hypothetical protein